MNKYRARFDLWLRKKVQAFMKRYYGDPINHGVFRFHDTSIYEYAKRFNTIEKDISDIESTVNHLSKVVLVGGDNGFDDSIGKSVTERMSLMDQRLNVLAEQVNKGTKATEEAIKELNDARLDKGGDAEIKLAQLENNVKSLSRQVDILGQGINELYSKLNEEEK